MALVRKAGAVLKLSGRLIPLYQEMHRNRRYRGGSTLRNYVADIEQIIAATETRTILDYGCGKGAQYHEDGLHETWGIMPTLFDPGVPSIDELPAGQFDGVICTGVLEHIPGRELPQAFSNLAGYARKWCFLAIGTALAHKRLPDGRNAHVTIKAPEWWMERIEPYFAGGAALHYRWVA